MKKSGKKEFNRGVKWLVWSGILASASIGGWYAYSQVMNRPAEPVPVREITVKQDTVEETINESGTVELGNQQTLKSPAEGAVEEVRVRLGDRVESGQELIVLRNPERQTILANNQLTIQQQELTQATNRQKIAAAEEKVKNAEKALQDIRNKSNAERQSKLDELQFKIQQNQLAQTKNREVIVTAEENLAAAQRKLQTAQKLFDKGFISEDDLQSQKDQVRSTITALRDAQSQLNSTSLEFDQLQIARQKIEREFQDKLVEERTNFRQVESNLKTANFELQDAELAVRQATLEIQKNQIERQKIEQELKDNIVSAPIDGKVLDIKVKAGDGVAVKDDLLTLGDPSVELVKLQLSTLNAGKIIPNQEARISVIGVDKKTFQGRVKNLSPLAQSGTGSSDESSSQSGGATVPATVQLDTPTGTLIPGSLVNVEIVLLSRQNVVVLETEAVQRQGSKPFVWVRDPQGNAQKQPVTLGLEGLVNVEIVSGLRSGDKVLLPPPEPSLEPGMPVIPQAEEPKDKETKEQ